MGVDRDAHELPVSAAAVIRASPFAVTVTLNGEMTMSGDEITGAVNSSPAVAEWFFLRRVNSSPPPRSQ